MTSFYDKLLTITFMISFSNLDCTLRLSQGDDKCHKERASPISYLGLIDQAQHYLWASRPNTYTTWPKNTKPKYKTQIILNNLYNLENFPLMLYFLQSDLSRFAFGPEQLVESLNRLKWAQSSKKLLIYLIVLCPLYSLTKVIGTYSITRSHTHTLTHTHMRVHTQ